MFIPKTPVLYIGDLPFEVDEDFLIKNLFNNFEIKDLILKIKPGNQKKFAFITFEKFEEANQVLNEMNYTKLNGIPIRISWADEETIRIKDSGVGCLFIKGLDENIGVSNLHKLFSNFGEVISCKIPLGKDHSGEIKSKGYGYVQFRNLEDSEKALRDLTNASINEKNIIKEKYEKKKKLIQKKLLQIFILKILIQILLKMN